MANSPHIKNITDVEWLEERSPDGTAWRYRRKLGAETGATALGCSAYRIEPGAKPWPRHYHCANEEAIFVQSGSGSILIGDELHALKAGDYVALPAGDHPHQIQNNSDEDLLFLCLSTMVHPDVCVYPDSGKIGVFTGTAPGGSPDSSAIKLFVATKDERSYWDGEDG